MKCNELLFFFFQAEDGIRDRNVTGVQTCALPISRSLVAQLSNGQLDFLGFNASGGLIASDLVANTVGLPTAVRSEERRVGKECRARWSRDYYRTSEYVRAVNCTAIIHVHATVAWS